MSRYRTIFGPIPSRRFGTSLGIDLSPGRKQCNFDCLYCELAAAKPVDRIDDPPSVGTILDELTQALKEHPDIDVVTVTANGEPTLYPHLDELIEAIDRVKGDFHTLILTNASTIDDPKIRRSLAKFDTVKLSLDSVTDTCFKKIDRPYDGISVATIIEGIASFRTIYHGTMVLEILLLPGLNDSDREIEAFNHILPMLGADRIDLGTVDRPPAYPVEPLDYEKLLAVARKLDPSLPIHIASRHTGQPIHAHYSDEEIVNTLAKRPLTREDIAILFDEESLERFRKLLQEGTIEEKKSGGITFYGTRFSEQKVKKRKKTS